VPRFRLPGEAGRLLKHNRIFVASNKRIAVIWDNAKCHKGEAMRKALSQGGALERVHLIPLPPYAPDCNPIEHVWDCAKDELANHQCSTFAEMKHQFMRLVNGQRFTYQI
jgi:transposase